MLDEQETQTYNIVDVNGRGILTDTRTGASWLLCGVDEGKPYWKPIRWADKAEEKK